MKIAKDRDPSGQVESRLISLVASLFFSVPTAGLLWLAVNKELARWDGFLSSNYLVACILAFAVMALLVPRLFPAILGGIWRGIIWFERW